MRELTQAQREAVAYQGGDQVILAAAGSGKTLVLVEKAAHLIEKERIPFEKILVVTFTDKAGNEIRERIARRLQGGGQSFVGTIHAFAAQMLRKHGAALQLQTDFRILEDFISNLEKIRIVREGLLSFLEARDPEALEAVDRYGLRRSLRLFIDFLSRDVSERLPFPSLSAKLRDLYTQRKREGNFLDFDDLEHFLLKLLSLEKYRKLLQNQFRWLIVDEFQDINPTQWKIISMLYDGGANRLIIVGDPRQSIYRFRGADPSLFKQVSDEILERGGRLFSLNENFRSSGEVIRFVNRSSRVLFADRYPPMVPTRRDLEGKVDLLTLPRSTNANDRRKAEAKAVAEEIARLHQHGGYAWKSIALLFRTRKATPFFESELRAKGIPYETRLGESLLERPEVLSLIFAMRKSIATAESEIRLIDTALGLSPLSTFQGTISPEPLDSYIAALFESTLFLFSAETQNNLIAFRKLLENLIGLGVKDLKGLLKLLSILREEEAKIPCPQAENPADAVRLMTVHASKGLEFPIVLLCDIDARTSSRTLYREDDDGTVVLQDRDGEATGLKDRWVKSEKFKTIEQQEKEEATDESKRLLYVALTRTIEQLILPLSPHREEGKKDRTLWGEWLHAALES